MCILFIAIGQHPRYPLIIAANRDEYHARPSAPMHYWPDQPGILAGRDRRAGGTWFGVNANGRIAAVTNHRSTETDADVATPAQSRGELVARFLRNDEAVSAYGEFLRAAHRDFSPFNLIYGTPGRLHCFSSAGPVSYPLAGGFHSISNGAPDEQWPKMSRGVSLLKKNIAAGQIESEDLAQVMKDRTQAPADSIVHERHLSSIFVTGEHYGTRATTLLLGTEDAFSLHEYNYTPDGGEQGRRFYSVALAS